MKTVKQEIIDMLQSMPDDIDYDEIMEKIYFKQSIQKSLQDITEGRTLTHEEAKARLAKWIK